MSNAYIPEINIIAVKNVTTENTNIVVVSIKTIWDVVKSLWINAFSQSSSENYCFMFICFLINMTKKHHDKINGYYLINAISSTFRPLK